MRVSFEWVAVAAVIVASTGVVLGVQAPAPMATEMASYTTDLENRTPHQRFNADRAAGAIDGMVVKPGGVFSFDDAVGGWSGDQGYLKAPVSYNGVLVDDYGGGVCETSTTLYNAALLAGLPILERHPHTFSPSYVPPGRDAAVAYPTADLRFRNDTGSPITIRVRADRGRLICRLLSLGAPPSRVTLSSTILDRKPPSSVSAADLDATSRPRSRWHVRGRDGLRIAIYRAWYSPQGETRRELVSDDTYLPISPYAW